MLNAIGYLPTQLCDDHVDKYMVYSLQDKTRTTAWQEDITNSKCDLACVGTLLVAHAPTSIDVRQAPPCLEVDTEQCKDQEARNPFFYFSTCSSGLSTG